MKPLPLRCVLTADPNPWQSSGDESLVVQVENIQNPLRLIEENDSPAEDHALPIMRQARQPGVALLGQGLYPFFQPWRESAITL